MKAESISSVRSAASLAARKLHSQKRPEVQLLGRGPQDAMDSYVWKTDIADLEKYISKNGNFNVKN